MRNLLRWSKVLKSEFGGRVQKVVLDTGAGCPHRDGLTGGGCIFCDERGGGSGAFLRNLSLREQVKRGVQGAFKHYKTQNIILYFQSYSATNVPVEDFRESLVTAFDEAEKLGANVKAISVGTRPDLVPPAVVEYLQSLTGRCQVWLELGVQTTDPSGLAWLNRAHTVDAIKDALLRLRQTNIRVCAHLIAGIKGELPDQLKRSALQLVEWGVDALKFHPLCVLHGTDLERIYRSGGYVPLTKEEYLDRLEDAVIALPEGIILQRMTAGVRADRLEAPLWVLDKNGIDAEIERRISAFGKE